MAGFDLSRRARGDLVNIGLFSAERWGEERSAATVSMRISCSRCTQPDSLSAQAAPLAYHARASASRK